MKKHKTLILLTVSIALAVIRLVILFDIWASVLMQGKAKSKQ